MFPGVFLKKTIFEKLNPFKNLIFEGSSLSRLYGSTPISFLYFFNQFFQFFRKIEKMDASRNLLSIGAGLMFLSEFLCRSKRIY